MDRIRDTAPIAYDDDADDTWRAAGWAELPFFLAAARAGTLRAAAQHLKVNHATVDRNIKSLERAYGVTLFERNSRGLSLTFAGKGLFEKAMSAEEAVIDARRKVRGLDDAPAGPVHVSLSKWHACYYFSKKMTLFRERYPEIDLRITVSDQVEDLTKSPADIAIRAAWHVEEDVIARKIGTYYAAALASQEYLDRHWDKRGPNGEGLHWIGKTTLWPNPELEALNLFPSAKRDIDVRDPLLINEMLAQGCGIALVPLGATYLFPNLRVVPGTPVAKDRTMWVIYHPDLKQSARVRAVVDSLLEMFRPNIEYERAQIRKFGF